MTTNCASDNCEINICEKCNDFIKKCSLDCEAIIHINMILRKYCHNVYCMTCYFANNHINDYAKCIKDFK